MMKTAKELILLLATRIMGWRLVQESEWSVSIPHVCMWDAFYGRCYYTDAQGGHAWEPLRSDADAFMLVDALSDHFFFDLTLRGAWEATFHDERYRHVGGSKDRRRAIVFAALKATAPGA
jgi:hypothetical protein